MKPFSERNQVAVGGISLVALTLMGMAAFYSDDLPIIGGGTSYTAHFRESAGLQPNNEVRAAGVKIGKVTDVELEGGHVTVTFRVKDAWIGDRSSAAIKIKTLLGQKYLAVDPQGGGALNPETPIPLDRTTSPYDVTEAFNGLAETVGQIDTTKLGDAFTVLADAFRDSPPHVRSAVDGLSALSTTISSRDEALARLLANTKQITGTLADRSGQFEKLISDGNLLLEEVRKRKNAISELLDGTRALSQQLSGLVEDNRAQIGPMLTQLDRVTTVLQRNQDNLSRALALTGPLYRVVGNAAGNGRWIDTYICGLVPPSTPNGPACNPPGAGG
jgi:phospholipid/cholesterol/gamma-HCH transport system substrate-binding protein